MDVTFFEEGIYIHENRGKNIINLYEDYVEKYFRRVDNICFAKSWIFGQPY